MMRWRFPQRSIRFCGASACALWAGALLLLYLSGLFLFPPSKIEASSITQQSYTTVQEAGTPLTQRAILNCASGMFCSDDAANKRTTISTAGVINAPFISQDNVNFYGVVSSITNPNLPSWAWRNQNSSTLSVSSSGVQFLTVPIGPGSTATWSGREIAIPTAPYTVDILVNGFANGTSLDGNNGWGIYTTNGTEFV